MIRDKNSFHNIYRYIYLFFFITFLIVFKTFTEVNRKIFATEEKAKEIEQFFAEYPFPDSERTVEQSVEIVRLNTE